MTTPAINVDATHWPKRTEPSEPSRMLNWKCVIGLSFFQCVIAVIFSDAAAQGATELARVVTVGSMPVLGMWSLQN
jgi:hypothetical protein